MIRDVVILGAGHNALVAAAYLARAGRSVLVLERRRELGGTAVTEELAPGFHASAVFAGVETFAPELVRELRLAERGLELAPAAPVMVPRPGGDALWLPPGKAATATAPGAAPRDAEALAELDGFLRRLADAFAPVLGAPLPDLEPAGVGGLFELLGPGLRLRRLGRRDLAEAMRFLPMPIADVVEERFDDEALRVAVATGGLTASWLGPRSPGSALNLLLHRSGLARGAVGHPRFARGGAGGLVAALLGAVHAAGAEIRTEAEVREIAIGRGGVRGVVLANGEEIRAAAVLSCLDPRRTFLELVDAGHLEPSFLWRVRNVRARGAVALVHYALERLPAFAGAPAGEPPPGRILAGPAIDDLERAYDAAKYGRLPERPYLDLTVPTVADPSLAPEGRHVLSAWVQYPPRELRDGDWATAGDELAAIVERRIEELAPGFGASILARRVLTPADLEERFGLTGGCLYHVEPALDQELYMRPLPRWARHDTPVRGLYLGGAGTHGGGGLTGLAGRNAARRLLARG